MESPPHNGTVNSKRAAERVKPSAAVARLIVFEAISNAGIHGLTREEIEAVTGLPGNTVRPRVWDLMKTNAIEEGGEVRPCKSGSYGKVLTVVGITAEQPQTNKENHHGNQ